MQADLHLEDPLAPLSFSPAPYTIRVVRGGNGILITTRGFIQEWDIKAEPPSLLREMAFPSSQYWSLLLHEEEINGSLFFWYLEGGGLAGTVTKFDYLNFVAAERQSVPSARKIQCNAHIIVTSDYGNIKLYDKLGTLLKTYSGSTWDAVSLKVTKDYILCAIRDQQSSPPRDSVGIWSADAEMKLLTKVQTSEPIRALDTNGELVYGAGWGGSLHIWHMKTRQLISSIPVHKSNFETIICRGNIVVCNYYCCQPHILQMSAGADMNVSIWNHYLQKVTGLVACEKYPMDMAWTRDTLFIISNDLFVTKKLSHK